MDVGQGVAVLGVAMVALAEELGADMAIRSLQHLLQYGEPSVRRAVPLALGLLSVSNPRVSSVWCSSMACSCMCGRRGSGGLELLQACCYLCARFV